jgi:hypothetical protein
MHDHLEEGDCGNADGGEVVRVGAPWTGILEGLLSAGGVVVERVFGWVDERY